MCKHEHPGEGDGEGGSTGLDDEGETIDFNNVDDRGISGGFSLVLVLRFCLVSERRVLC